MGLTPEQLELRRSGIGGSDIAAILGLSPYATPLDVFRSKVENYVQSDSWAFRRGRLLEPVVAQIYAEETGAMLREVGTLRHPDRSIVLATPDRIADRQERGSSKSRHPTVGCGMNGVRQGPMRCPSSTSYRSCGRWG
jgi:putative phage-type endonuclease